VGHDTLKLEPGLAEQSFGDVLEEVLRQGARKMLQAAIENEVNEYLERYGDNRDGTGRRLVVRNGYLPEREIVTGIGPLRVRQPRVDDRKLRRYNGAEVFSSKILPRYLRRIPSIDNLIPALYLKGDLYGGFSPGIVVHSGRAGTGAFCYQHCTSQGQVGAGIHGMVPPGSER